MVIVENAVWLSSFDALTPYSPMSSLTRDISLLLIAVSMNELWSELFSWTQCRFKIPWGQGLE